MALHCRHEYLPRSFFVGLRLHKRSHKFLPTATQVYVHIYMCVYVRARVRVWYRCRKTRRTIFLRMVMRYPADCLQRTFLSRATNKNASPTDIEKSLGDITPRYTWGIPPCVSRACKRVPFVLSLDMFVAVISIILRYCPVPAKLW